MRNTPVVGVAVLVLLAGCGGFFGGPTVVDDECAEVIAGIVSCEVVVENPEDYRMAVNVSVEIRGGSSVLDADSEVVEIGPGERENVSIALGGSGDLRYAVDVEEVSS